MKHFGRRVEEIFGDERSHHEKSRLFKAIIADKTYYIKKKRVRMVLKGTDSPFL